MTSVADIADNQVSPQDPVRPAVLADPQIPAGSLISSRQRWLGFSAVLAAMMLNLLDSTIVNIAGPSIRRDLGGSLSTLQWMAAAYTIAMSAGLLTGGRLGDMFGRRRMLLIGLSGFLVASVACAVAWDPAVMIGARVGQGLFAAALIPQAFGLIRDLFPPNEIGKAFAALGPVIGVATVVGPVVAGLLIKADLFGSDWRAIFLINLPIGLFALIAGFRALPAAINTQGRAAIRLDVLGTILIGITMFLLVFPLVQGRELGWPVWAFGMLAAAVPMLALFVAQQRRRTRTGRSPLVELSVLRKRSYASGVLFVIIFFGTIVGLSLALGLFLQIGLGFTPMRASLFLAALAVGAFFGSGVGAVAVSTVGRPILHVGLSIMAIGTALLFLALSRAGGDVGFIGLAPGLFVYGLGMGMIFVPLFDIIIGDIEDHEIGSASGLLEALQQLGASLGIAVLATLFFSTFALEDGGPQAAIAAGRHVDAAQLVLLVTGALLALAFVVGFLLPQKARDSH